MNQEWEQQKSTAVMSSNKLTRVLINILSLPKSLYFNLRCLPLKQAIKMPFLISYRVKIAKAKRNVVVFQGTPHRFMVRIGFGGSEGIISRRSLISFEKGTVTFKGKAIFSEGISLCNRGQLSFGENFLANKNSTIWCSLRIEFGKDVSLGWNTYARDSDGEGHRIWIGNELSSASKEILVGDHNWIGSEVHMLKGAGIGHDCVVGYRSLLTKRFIENNVIIAGQPAKVIRDNIHFEL